MNFARETYRCVLAATDFSPSAAAATRLAAWVAERSGCELTLVHAIENLHEAVHRLSGRAKLDLVSGEGELFEKEVRSVADQKLRVLASQLESGVVRIRCEVLLGEAFLEITHVVQSEKFDLVMTGTRGVSGWKQFFVGSTAKKLIRNCPSSVWIVKAEHAVPPEVVIGAADFSEASRKAVLEGLWIAREANAEFHLVHVIDSRDVPEDLLDSIPPGSSVRAEINRQAEERLAEFLQSLGDAAQGVNSHLTWGYPWQEIARIAQKHQADLIVLGTVGRSGIKGILLGNTCERVLETCDCSVLTVKPDDYVSPIEPATWPLHP
ncbi:MAG: universal stress protein [Planctomycetota bacterium]